VRLRYSCRACLRAGRSSFPHPAAPRHQIHFLVTGPGPAASSGGVDDRPDEGHIALAVENAQLYQESLRNAALLEERVRERTLEFEAKSAELERINKLFVGRELRMRELKERIKELEQKVTAP
jgi:hypothetical protein